MAQEADVGRSFADLPPEVLQAIGRLLKPKSMGRARLACRSLCDAILPCKVTLNLSKCHEYSPRLLKLLDASAHVTILIPLAAHTSPAAPLRKLLADIHPNCRVCLLVRAAAQVPAESARRLVLGLRHALEYLPGRNFLLAVPRFEPAPRSLESFLDWRSYDEMLEQERALHASHLLVSSQLLAHAMPLAGLETASLTLGSLDHGQLRHLAGCARLTALALVQDSDPVHRHSGAAPAAPRNSTLQHVFDALGGVSSLRSLSLHCDLRQHALMQAAAGGPAAIRLPEWPHLEALVASDTRGTDFITWDDMFTVTQEYIDPKDMLSLLVPGRLATRLREVATGLPVRAAAGCMAALVELEVGTPKCLMPQELPAMPALEELVVSGGVMGREELQLLLAALEAAPGLQVLELGSFGGGEDELDDRAVLESMLLQLVQALGAHCSQLRSLHIRELDLTDFELTFDLPLGHPFSLVGGNRLRYSARSGCEWLAALSGLKQLQDLRMPSLGLATTAPLSALTKLQSLTLTVIEDLQLADLPPSLTSLNTNVVGKAPDSWVSPSRPGPKRRRCPRGQPAEQPAHQLSAGGGKTPAAAGEAAAAQPQEGRYGSSQAMEQPIAASTDPHPAVAQLLHLTIHCQACGLLVLQPLLGSLRSLHLRLDLIHIPSSPRFPSAAAIPISTASVTLQCRLQQLLGALQDLPQLRSLQLEWSPSWVGGAGTVLALVQGFAAVPRLREFRVASNWAAGGSAALDGRPLLLGAGLAALQVQEQLQLQLQRRRSDGDGDGESEGGLCCDKVAQLWPASKLGCPAPGWLLLELGPLQLEQAAQLVSGLRRLVELMEALGEEVESEEKELLGRMERVKWRLLMSSRKRSRQRAELAREQRQLRRLVAEMDAD